MNARERRVSGQTHILAAMARVRCRTAAMALSILSRTGHARPRPIRQPRPNFSASSISLQDGSVRETEKTYDEEGRLRTDWGRNGTSDARWTTHYRAGSQAHAAPRASTTRLQLPHPLPA
jgi:hypothetical protein